MKKTFLLAALAMAMMTSCKKDKKDEVTKENIAGTYKLTASTSKFGNNPESDEYALLDACEKDDLVKLNANLTFSILDAGTKCTPPGDENGTWSLPSSSEIIIMGEKQTIKSFDGRTLIVSYSIGTGNTLYTLTSTLVKQ